MHVAFGWLSELGWKNFMPQNFPEINRYFSLTSYCNMIGQSNNAFSILGFSLVGNCQNKEAMFWSFPPLADRTNNKHLLQPFVKVIQKSLYLDNMVECNVLNLTKYPKELKQ